MSQSIRELEAELNQMTAKGQILDALAKFYCEQCTFEEADGVRRESRRAQHEHLSAFFASLRGFNTATLHASGVGEDVSLSEWTFDMTGGKGEPIVWNEVLVRRWHEGKVVSERFYNAA